MNKIDLDAARRFLDQLESGGQFTFQTFPDRKDKPAAAGLTQVLHGAPDCHLKTLASLNEQGAGIFVMVNQGDGVVLPSQKTCRTIRNVKRVRALFVDLDGAPIEPVLEAELEPTILVESSPDRWHAYWKVDECPLGQFKASQVALAKRFGGDESVNDLSRVMRIPGFIHQKTDDHFVTRMVDFNQIKEKYYENH